MTLNPFEGLKKQNSSDLDGYEFRRCCKGMARLASMATTHVPLPQDKLVMDNPHHIYSPTHILYIYIYIYVTLPGWWFGTFFIFPYIGNNHPN